MKGQQEYCFEYKLNTGDEMDVNYVVSGYNEQKLRFYILAYQMNEQGTQNIEQSKNNFQVLFSHEQVKEFQYKFTAKDFGFFDFCFKALDSSAKVLSFDIQKVEDRYADKKTFSKAVREFDQLYKSLQQVNKNQHYQSIREQTHNQILESTEKRVKLCSLIKMTMMIIIVLVQTTILTGFFKEKKPSETSQI